MNHKILIATLLVAGSLGLLVSTAIRDTKKAVVTVAELIEEGVDRQRIRLGARVSDTPISVRVEPERLVEFSVVDPDSKSGPQLAVRFAGAMPDTLRSGRDVILEGNFEKNSFVASSLMTQCPSKYEPPIPGDRPEAAYKATL